ncbi:MAG: cache domain-containing protein, partial [Planctomycetota bacterium]
MLARKFFLGVVLPLAIFVAATQVGTYLLIKGHLQEQADERLLRTVEELDRAITERLVSAEDDLRALRGCPEIDQHLQLKAFDEHVAASGELVELESQFVAIAAVKPHLRSIRFHQSEGRALVRVRNGARHYVALDASKAAWFRWAQRADPGEVLLNDPQPPGSADATITAVTPVHHAGRMRGAVVIEIPVRNLIGSLATGRTLGSAGYAYITGPDGTILSHQSEKDIGLNGAGLWTTQRVQAGYRGVFTESAETDDAVLMRKAFLPQARVRLGLVVAVPQDQVLAPVQRVTTWILVIFASGLAFVLLVGGALGRRTVAPLKRLTELSTRVAHGELDLDVKAETRDEVGQLATSFAGMVRSLKASRENLEEQVVARTHELNEAKLQAEAAQQ